MMTAFMARWIGKFSQFDQRSFRWLNHRLERCCRHQIVRWISRSGDGYVYALIALMMAIYLETESVIPITALLIGFAIEVPLFSILKRILKRQRPYQKNPQFRSVILAHDQFSFPSGHTTAAFLFAGIMSAFFPAWSWVLYVWAAAIGASRVLLGVHYPGDILAGATLGYVISRYAISLAS
ncbi:phosphatase PAP2 family protein [Pseudidiomarina andamanensis]|nr:phosphatase PAP2 family protein [Pseudidiomarina andamanensis]MDS0218102.1 phosphatase PAP2 family protein [Pseudidiomarina andamanensis]